MGLYKRHNIHHFLLTLVTIFASQPTDAFNACLFPSVSTLSQHKESPFLLSSNRPVFVLRAATTTTFDIGLENVPGEDWKRPGKVNQDASFHREIGDDFLLIGVLDGHGAQGHHVSSYFAACLPSEIQQRLQDDTFHRLPVKELEDRLKEVVSELPSSLEKNDQISLALIDSFHAVHWNALLDSDQKPGRSGATCIACLIHKKTKECHIAYVGDSKAICFHDSSSSNKNLRVVAERTTVKNPEERKRIESAEGSIRGNNVFYGPVGIAMTRALGDAVMLRAGVIPTPVVQTFKLHDCDTLVLATDGIWDVMQDKEVVDAVEGMSSAQEMASSLASTARQRWVGDLPIMDEVKADDITVLVLSSKDRQ